VALPSSSARPRYGRGQILVHGPVHVGRNNKLEETLGKMGTFPSAAGPRFFSWRVGGKSKLTELDSHRDHFPAAVTDFAAAMDSEARNNELTHLDRRPISCHSRTISDKVVALPTAAG
jgi:hypothetical protein